MKHYINDEEFFKANLIHINKITGKILAYGNLAPVLLAGGIFLNLYEMPLIWLVIFSAFLIPFTIIQNILTRKCSNQKLVAYVTLFGVEVLIAFLGSNFNISILAKNMFSFVFKRSMCDVFALVTIAVVGSAIEARYSISPSPRIPISTTQKS
jgi:hypothetical protein